MCTVVNKLAKRCLSLCLLTLALYQHSYYAFAYDQFVINRSASSLDQRYQYTYDLLQLIIQVTQGDFGEASLQVSDAQMSRNRILWSLTHGNSINVIAEASNSQWSNKLIPVKIPIRKGIQGFRLFIIKKDKLPTLQRVTTLEQLMALSTGSGSQWSTRVAMEQAGFKVIVSNQYENLFGMLSKGRFTTFGRGVNEIFQEVKEFHKHYPELVVEDQIMLKIPLATYYFVSPREPRLAKRIEAGLQKLIENGQFDKLFYQHHCKYLVQSKLDQRTTFEIDNPFFSESEINAKLGKDFLLKPQDDFAALCKGHLE